MSLTPYQQQSSILAANCEVADRQALILGEASNKDYSLAKKEYQLTHERFTSRVPRAAQPDPSTVITAQTMREDIRYYTSCPNPNMNSYHNEDGTVSTRAVDTQLKDRARTRQKEDLDRARKKQASSLYAGGAKKGGNEEPLTEMLIRLQEQEYDDLLSIEATHFRKLAKTYFDVFFGKFESVLSVEREGRRAMEDIELSVALGTLAGLRDRIHHSEELLMMRAMGYYPMQLVRNNRARQLEDAEQRAREEEAMRVLDSMYTVPLWQRVVAIRAETEAEQEVTIRTMMLAHATEADFIERNLGRHNMEKGGIFEIRRRGAVPEYLDESVRYISTVERLFCELGEESGRMALVDEALQGCDEIWGAMNQAPEAAEAM